MKNKVIKLASILAGMAISGQYIQADEQAVKPEIAESKELRESRLKWFREARFGMFIHWRVYAVPAGVYKGNDIIGLRNITLKPVL